MQRTLVLVKPDAIQRGLAGEVISRLERRGLKIVAMKFFQVSEPLAQEHYHEHQDKPFFGQLVQFITSAPIIAAVFEGRRAIEVVRITVGETDAAKALPGTIRGDMAISNRHNLVHASDSVESATKEIALFFSPDEICAYTHDIDKWVIES